MFCWGSIKRWALSMISINNFKSLWKKEFVQNLGVNFINMFTCSFYDRRSQKHKNTVNFCAFRIYTHKTFAWNVGEIDHWEYQKRLEVQRRELMWKKQIRFDVGFSSFNLNSSSNYITNENRKKIVTIFSFTSCYNGARKAVIISIDLFAILPIILITKNDKQII